MACVSDKGHGKTMDYLPSLVNKQFADLPTFFNVVCYPYVDTSQYVKKKFEDKDNIK